jgi:MoxR-like ATPase
MRKRMTIPENDEKAPDLPVAPGRLTPPPASSGPAHPIPSSAGSSVSSSPPIPGAPTSRIIETKLKAPPEPEVYELPESTGVVEWWTQPTGIEWCSLEFPIYGLKPNMLMHISPPRIPVRDGVEAYCYQAGKIPAVFHPLRERLWPDSPTKWEDLPGFSFDLAQNRRTIRSYQAGSELIFGIPNTAQFGTLSDGSTIESVDRVDFHRWAWGAYNGSVFSGHSFKPALNVALHTVEPFPTNRSEEWEDMSLEEVNNIASKILSDIGVDPYVDTAEADKRKAARKPASSADKPITRPNGELYYPRKVRTGMRDADTLLDVDLLARSYRAKIPALLMGSPGTGKNALAEASLPDLITLGGTSDTEVSDFVGTYAPVSKDTYEWIHGPLVVAMLEGRPLLVDEIALIEPRVLAVLYSVMDGRGELNVTANPDLGVVVAEEGFYVLGACNPNVPGAIMSDALLSRFALQVEVTTDYDTVLKLGVDRSIITVAKHLARQVVAGDIRRAPETRELLAFQKIYNEFGRDLAIANLIATADESDREVYEATINSTLATRASALKI